QPARGRGKSRHLHPGCVLPRHRKERPIRRLRVCAGEGQPCCRNHPVDSEAQGVDEAGIESVVLVDDKYLPPRVISGPLVVKFVGLPDLPCVEHVGAGKRVLFRHLMIHFGREVIFGRDLLPGKRKNSRVSGTKKRAVWQGIKSIHKTEDCWINRYLPRGEVARACSRGGHRIHLGHSRGRTQALVITKNESAILYDRPTERSSKLIAAEGRLLSIKEISRVQRTVPKELIN